MNTADAARIRAVAAKEDLSRLLCFVFVLVAAAASLLAVVLLLHTTHNLPPAQLARHIALSGVAVAASWLLVHTVFTCAMPICITTPAPMAPMWVASISPVRRKSPTTSTSPYFSFVVGMTAQTADVGISGRGLRRLTLLHGLISFVFNTALVALVINGVAGIM